MVGELACARRLELSARVLAFEARLAGIAAGVMACALAGAGLWVLGGNDAPRHLFATGAINMIELAVMAMAAAAALSIARRGVRLAR